MKHWYVIQAQPQRENTARQRLADQGFDVFWPHERRDRIVQGRPGITHVPLFAGYVFVRLDVVTQQWHPILRAPGVLRMILDGDRPAALSTMPRKNRQTGESEPSDSASLDALRDRADANGLLLTEHKATADLVVKIGQMLEIVTGPLAEERYNAITGKVVATRGDHVMMEIPCFGGTVPIWTPLASVAPAPNQEQLQAQRKYRYPQIGHGRGAARRV